jgi:hypothetical protein
VKYQQLCGKTENLAYSEEDNQNSRKTLLDMWSRDVGMKEGYSSKIM